MCIPKKDILLKRIDCRNYLFKKCDYYPCHKELESCNTCFCIFYPCEDTALGEYVNSSRGGKIWSCMNCNWIHKEEIVNSIREFIKVESNRLLAPREMYLVFIKELESRKNL